ncbi:hypothetical protein K440DRAFT_615735 [Wilcoxina mikolae CBS 423.85]|nr:hypothetical protein K440DRAFT_615735 [Wilcoxina mikolae CBS 423.85]
MFSEVLYLTFISRGQLQQLGAVDDLERMSKFDEIILETFDHPCRIFPVRSCFSVIEVLTEVLQSGRNLVLLRWLSVFRGAGCINFQTVFLNGPAGGQAF